MGRRRSQIPFRVAKCGHLSKPIDGTGPFFCRGQSRERTTAILEKCTCCVIKPHVLRSRSTGAVLQRIIDEERFEISAVGLYYLERTSAAEFLEVYKGALPEFNAMADELCSGPVLALEIVFSPSGEETTGEDVVESFRFFAGPWDVGMALELHPSSLRAQFGIISRDKINNAVHCTDLGEDGEHEVAYFFDNPTGALK
mmetsp:Transcript_2963/g.5551  ORF Transcript_2963/g.5551 Transcript_2963/m.5551 type:complete len:199 (-) Transcript_2963:74-670(-)